MDERPLEWRTVIDTADGRDEMIVANWQQFAALAWKGYSDAGRGAVLVDLKAAENAVTHPGIIAQARYLPIDPDRIRETLYEPERNDVDVVDADSIEDNLRDMANYIRAYDPTREMVFFIVSGDGDCLRCKCLHSQSEYLLNPPDAYRAETSVRRNDPYLS
jgi:hypothetical protein